MVFLHLTRHLLDADWIEPSRSRAGVELRFGRIDQAGVREVITAHFDRKAAREARTIDAPHL
jgi:hypothetical protein